MQVTIFMKKNLCGGCIDKKYKWVYLYINSKTGKIIQKSSKELKDDDNDN